MRIKSEITYVNSLLHLNTSSLLSLSSITEARAKLILLIPEALFFMPSSLIIQCFSMFFAFQIFLY